MHMQCTPQTMQRNPRYDDVLTEVYDALARRVEARLVQAGFAVEVPKARPGASHGNVTLTLRSP